MKSLGRTFKRTKTPEEVRARLEADLPVGSPAAQARAWLSGHGIEFADHDDVIRFTLDGPRRGLMVSVRWIVTLRLEHEHISGIEVEEGLLGP